jgi:hypothetical protein
MNPFTTRQILYVPKICPSICDLLCFTGLGFVERSKAIVFPDIPARFQTPNRNLVDMLT